MDIQLKCMVDQEIFTLKIVHVKYFHVVKFRVLFGHKIYLTVDGYNMDKHLECSQQVSGESSWLYFPDLRYTWFVFMVLLSQKQNHQ